VRLPTNVPNIVYGTAWKKDDTSRLVVLAIKSGFRAIDTANQPKHYNEPGVGAALEQLGEFGLSRDDIFLQTKFTPIDGQDHRVPYDSSKPLAVQVRTSFESSLKNLGTTWLDSYLLHGPYGRGGLNDSDYKVWQELEAIYEQGLVKRIGISNITKNHLVELLASAKTKPMVVQNRCYANRGWDSDVRTLCKEHGIIYQGFSLLTANRDVLTDSRIQAIALKYKVQPAQIIFRFAQQIGMQPLTGTTNETHMLIDLQSDQIKLSDQELAVVEQIGSHL
jgi:diketogulonate reductase-like aldo/keto reductase